MLPDSDFCFNYTINCECFKRNLLPNCNFTVNSLVKITGHNVNGLEKKMEKKDVERTKSRNFKVWIQFLCFVQRFRLTRLTLRTVESRISGTQNSGKSRISGQFLNDQLIIDRIE